jgi:hypothetical protein
MAVEKILLQFEADIKDLKSELGEVKSQLGNVEKQTEQTGSKMTNTFKNVGKAIAGAFAIREVVRFGQEAIRLAATLEGVEAAFKRIAAPGLLDELRKQTRGTVSDLQLMQNAVKASNFQIPLEQLGKLFAFAQQRARETGESVDYLVDSIVLGIGRKSPLILDNLGISAVRLRDEFKGLGIESAGVGDVARVVANIIDEEMGKAGETIETTAEKMERMSASFKNLQTDIGQKLLPIMDILIGALEDVGQGAVFVQDKIFELFNFLGSQKAKQALESKEAQALVDTYLEMGLSVQELTFKQTQLQDSLAQMPKLMQENRQANGNNQESYKALVEAQDSMKTELLAVNTVLQILNTSMTGSADGSGDGGTSGALDQLTKSFKVNKEELASFILELRDLNGVFAEALDVTGLGMDIERMAEAIGAPAVGIELLKEGTAEYIDTNALLNENLKDSIFYAMQLSDAMGMLQGSIVDIAGEQEKFTNFLQTISIAQILFARSVAIAEAVKGAATGLDQPGGLLKFLATTTFVIAQITGFIGDSLKTARGTQIPAYAKGVVDLKGDGTETSDSILARLSKGESVITAKGTKQDKKLFEAANKLMLDEYIHANYVLPALKDKQNSDKAMFDDYRLYRTLITGQKQDKEMNKQLIKVLGQRVNKHNNWA